MRKGEPLASIRDLSIQFSIEGGLVHAVRGLTWEIYPGEVVGVVGESGSGKSVTMSSLLGLLPPSTAKILSGQVKFAGVDLLELSDRQLRKIRGKEISLIFQDPMASFNPVKTIGNQISEAIRVHDRSITRRAARERVVDLLASVGVPSAKTRFDQFPHEYSGGMRQRAMIAMAIANRPKLIIADEPTTALDVTIQAQVIDVLKLVQQETNAAIILVTHDMGLIAELADRVLVMYAGRIVESAGVRPLFERPRHPYTLGLLGSLPRIDEDVDQLVSIRGQPPTLTLLPPGCAFEPRCEVAQGREICKAQEPVLARVDTTDRMTACHFFNEVGKKTLAGR